MFKHLLVPLDLSDRNARLLRIALSLARQSGARVTLLHVVDRIAHTSLRQHVGAARHGQRLGDVRLDAEHRHALPVKGLNHLEESIHKRGGGPEAAP